MRTITIPRDWIIQACDPSVPGATVCGPVWVDWPELQLTEQQVLANAVARALGSPAPHDDLSIFTVALPRVFNR